MRGFVFFTFCTFCLASNSFALSLNEALIEAYQNNMGMKAAREKLKTYDEEVAKANFGFLPTLSYDAKDSRSTNYQSTTPALLPDGKTTSRVRGFNLKQNIFNGGKDVFTMQYARYNLLYGRAELKQFEQKLLSNVIDSYLSLMQYKEGLAVAEKNVEMVTKINNGVKEKFKAGFATKADLAEVETVLSQAKVDKLNYSTNYSIALSQFKVLVGKEAIDLFHPEPPAIPEKLDDAIKIAMEQSPDLSLSKNRYLVDETSVKISATNLLPKVDLAVAWNHNSTLGSRQINSVKNNSKSVEFSVSVPIFQPEQHADVRKYKHSAYSSKENYNYTISTIPASVSESWNKVSASAESLDFYSKAYQSASTAYEGSMQIYREGLKTLTDLLNIEYKLYQASLQLIQARKSRLSSLYNLKNTIGTLTAKDLGLQTVYYNPDKHLETSQIKIIGF